MTIQFCGQFESHFRTLIKSTLGSEASRIRSSDQGLVLVHGDTGIDAGQARAALIAGKTVATIHAKKGQLDQVFPGTGMDVPADLALHAVTRMPIPGHPGMFHTFVTMVPESDAITIQASAADTKGCAKKLRSVVAELPDSFIVAQLNAHLAAATNADPNANIPNTPPQQTLMGILTYNQLTPSATRTFLIAEVQLVESSPVS